MNKNIDVKEETKVTRAFWRKSRRNDRRRKEKRIIKKKIKRRSF